MSESQLLYISGDQIDQLVSMDDALAITRESLTAHGLGLASNVPRRRTQVPGASLNIVGGGLNVGWLGAKVTASAGTGKMAWVLLFDADGVLRCLLQGNRLGQLRTGAATGVATDVLARRDSRVLACIGAGYQAWTQVEAVTRIRDVERIHVWNRTPERAEKFAHRLQQQLGILAPPFERVADAVMDADICVTITSAVMPVLQGADVKEGAHVVLAGSNHPERREADSDLFRRARAIYVDDLTQAKEVSGDLRLAVDEMACSWGDVRTLGSLMAAPEDDAAAGTGHDGGPTVFCFQGAGSWDVALASAVYERAVARKVGLDLPIDGSPEHP